MVGHDPGAPPDPHLPADHGLSALGLIMQLTGTVFAGVVAVMGLGGVIAVMMANAAYGRGDSLLTMWMLVIAASGVARAAMHRAAGTRLIYDGPRTPFAAIRRYLVVAVIQTVIWLAFYAFKMDAPAKVVLAIGIVLMAWPATLAVVISLPRFRRYEAAIPPTDDKGFEGAAILMLILGMVGLGTALVGMYALLQLPSRYLAELPGVLMLIVVGLLVIRSALHVIAGWRGVAETHVDRTAEAVSRYANFGVITALAASGAMLLMVMVSRADITGLLQIILIGWLLMAWPLIIRKFFGERQFADMLAGGQGQAPVHRRAADRGHTALGWLLLGFGVLAVSMAIGRALLLHGTGGGFAGMGDDNPLTTVLAMGASGHSAWWPVGVGALQIWAATELIRMTEHHRLVATIYGAVAAAVAIYTSLPLIDGLEAGPEAPIVFGMLAITLIVPVGTLVLVHRGGLKNRLSKSS